MRAIEGARSVEAIRVAHRLWNLNLTFSRDLLSNERHWEEWGEIIGAKGLAGLRIQRRRLWPRKIRRDVVPGLRHPIFVEHEFRLLWVGHDTPPYL